MICIFFTFKIFKSMFLENDFLETFNHKWHILKEKENIEKIQIDDKSFRLLSQIF